VSSSPPTSNFPELLCQLEACFQNEMSAARRDMAERLNQAGRRFRQAGNFVQTAAVLVEATAGSSKGAAVFQVSAGKLVGECVRGVPDAKAAGFRGLEVANAPALESAVASGEPVIAISEPGELSAALVEFFGHAPEERVGIVPIVAGTTVIAVL